MNTLNQTLLAAFLISFCSVIFAETGTSVSTTIIKTSPPSAAPAAIEKETSHTTITSTTFPGSPADDAIVSAVYAKYAKDPALIGTSLTVTSQNGIVTVNGTVTAQSQADAASIAAKAVAGVKDVRSNIHVTTNPNLNKSAPRAKY